jgi:hypothetical protein
VGQRFSARNAPGGPVVSGAVQHYRKVGRILDLVSASKGFASRETCQRQGTSAYDEGWRSDRCVIVGVRVEFMPHAVQDTEPDGEADA